MKTKPYLNICNGSEFDSIAARSAMLGYLDSLATIEDDRLQKRLLKELIHSYVMLEKRVDSLLKNTLPESVAEEIKYENRFSPRVYECTILFSDFVGFTRLAEKISGERLINTLHRLFTGFDQIVDEHGGTKIKTIGDAYMAVFGAPIQISDHALCALRSAMELFRYLNDFNGENDPPFDMRVGIHTGRVMAGVVGRDRMQFDVFGDDVNIASRFESSGEPGRINVSETTYLQTRGHMEFEERGLVALKNKPSMKAYFVKREKDKANP
ncbi:MAG: adenylate cyclase [Thermodesulfobacteriota bacterium]|nr:adenylate cyclase [Thermodesulfobacteriota bacterium]